VFSPSRADALYQRSWPLRGKNLNIDAKPTMHGSIKTPKLQGPDQSGLGLGHPKGEEFNESGPAFHRIVIRPTPSGCAQSAPCYQPVSIAIQKPAEGGYIVHRLPSLQSGAAENHTYCLTI